jgi:hypothetical protein
MTLPRESDLTDRIRALEDELADLYHRAGMLTHRTPGIGVRLVRWLSPRRGLPRRRPGHLPDVPGRAVVVVRSRRARAVLGGAWRAAARALAGPRRLAIGCTVKAWGW